MSKLPEKTTVVGGLGARMKFTFKNLRMRCVPNGILEYLKKNNCSKYATKLREIVDLNTGHIEYYPYENNTRTDFNSKWLKVKDCDEVQGWTITVKIVGQIFTLTQSQLEEYTQNPDTEEFLEVLREYCDNYVITYSLNGVEFFSASIKKFADKAGRDKLYLELKLIKLPITANECPYITLV